MSRSEKEKRSERLHPQLLKVIREPLYLAWLLDYKKVNHSIHEDWIREMWEPGNSLLMAHRNSYKTTCRVIGIIWGLIPRPNTRILVIRKTMDDASAIVSEIMQHYEKPVLRQFYQEVFGISEPRNTAMWAKTSGFSLSTKTKVTKERNVVPVGVGKFKTGDHYDLILPDDIVNLEDREYETVRENTKIYVKELVNIINNPSTGEDSLLEPGGIGLKFSGTPWHEDDAYANLKMEPMLYDADEHFIEEMTKERLREIRTEIDDDSLYEANYFLRHIDTKNKPFKNPQFTIQPEDFPQPFAYYDPAFGDTKKNDFNALSIGGRSGNEIFIDGGYIWRATIDKSYDIVAQYCHAHNVSVLFCESNQAQIAVAIALGELGIQVMPVPQYKNKHLRIMGFAKKLWGQLRFREDMERGDYLKQILAYVNPQYSKHDDAPDSLAGLIQCLAAPPRRGGRVGYFQT